MYAAVWLPYKPEAYLTDSIPDFESSLSQYSASCACRRRHYHRVMLYRVWGLHQPPPRCTGRSYRAHAHASLMGRKRLCTGSGCRPAYASPGHVRTISHVHTCAGPVVRVIDGISTVIAIGM